MKTDIRCIAFDCFGTVFDMSKIPRQEIAAYVAHVRNYKFVPYAFPGGWYDLKSHPDSKEGIEMLRGGGYSCVTLSNGDHDLICKLSQSNGIVWDKIIDLAEHKVYKPAIQAYRTVEIETGFLPPETLMVTANPTFGDIEGADAIGMQSRVIRNGYPETIVQLAKLLGC